MVFRKESRADSFQRQISALRQQLGTDQDDDEIVDDAEPMPDPAGLAERQAPTAARPTQPVIQRGSAPRTADASTGVIAAESSWSGTLRARGSLQIFGEAEGDISATGEIFVADGARVNARLSADVVVVAGVVDGTIECQGRLEVLPTGRVNGEVTSPTLVVQEGATVEGDLRMTSPAPVE